MSVMVTWGRLAQISLVWRFCLYRSEMQCTTVRKNALQQSVCVIMKYVYVEINAEKRRKKFNRGTSAACLLVKQRRSHKKFSEWKQVHVGVEPSKSNQTRWEWHHNTFITFLHLMPFSQLPYFLDQTPWLLFISSRNFVRLLFKSGY